MFATPNTEGRAMTLSADDKAFIRRVFFALSAQVFLCGSVLAVGLFVLIVRDPFWHRVWDAIFTGGFVALLGMFQYSFSRLREFEKKEERAERARWE
jgi:hypothetical protein